MTENDPDAFVCPHCQKETPAAEVGRWWAKRISGSKSKSEKKAASSRENGKKGGRPKKKLEAAESSEIT